MAKVWPISDCRILTYNPLFQERCLWVAKNDKKVVHKLLSNYSSFPSYSGVSTEELKLKNLKPNFHQKILIVWGNRCILSISKLILGSFLPCLVRWDDKDLSTGPKTNMFFKISRFFTTEVTAVVGLGCGQDAEFLISCWISVGCNIRLSFFRCGYLAVFGSRAHPLLRKTRETVSYAKRTLSGCVSSKSVNRSMHRTKRKVFSQTTSRFLTVMGWCKIFHKVPNSSKNRKIFSLQTVTTNFLDIVP